ncbi:hypothetical protein BCA33_19120 [Marinobacter sp. AC-23]|nr:hypothetical protein BCA33_19120 [Marinobacter sp. AC-23]
MGVPAFDAAVLAYQQDPAIRTRLFQHSLHVTLEATRNRLLIRNHTRTSAYKPDNITVIHFGPDTPERFNLTAILTGCLHQNEPAFPPVVVQPVHVSPVSGQCNQRKHHRQNGFDSSNEKIETHFFAPTSFAQKIRASVPT